MNDAICMVAVIVTVVLGWWRVDGVLYQSPADVCRVNACQALSHRQLQRSVSATSKKRNVQMTSQIESTYLYRLHYPHPHSTVFVHLVKGHVLRRPCRQLGLGCLPVLLGSLSTCVSARRPVFVNSKKQPHRPAKDLASSSRLGAQPEDPTPPLGQQMPEHARGGQPAERAQ